jgi:hypothetical protein
LVGGACRHPMTVSGTQGDLAANSFGLASPMLSASLAAGLRVLSGPSSSTEPTSPVLPTASSTRARGDTPATPSENPIKLGCGCGPIAPTVTRRITDASRVFMEPHPTARALGNRAIAQILRRPRPSGARKQPARSPIPPVLRGSPIWYGPTRVPGDNITGGRSSGRRPEGHFVTNGPTRTHCVSKLRSWRRIEITSRRKSAAQKPRFA